MTATFADDFDALFARRLRIARRDALAAFAAPDSFRVLLGAACTLALKQTPARPYGHLLVLAEREQPPKIFAAWPLPRGLVAPGTDALAALRALCERYGSAVVVRGRPPEYLVTDVLFHGIPRQVQEIYALPPERMRGRAAGQITQMRVTMNPKKNEMHLGLLYSIDPAELK